MAESKRQIAGAASRTRSNRRPAAERFDRLETMSEDLHQRLTTLEKRVTAMQAQLDHLKAKQHS